MFSKGPRSDLTCKAGGRLGEKLGTLHPRGHAAGLTLEGVAGSRAGLEFPCRFPRLRMKQRGGLAWPMEIGDDLFLTASEATPD